MKKLGIIAFSCFLTFGLALKTPAQTSSPQQPQNPSSTQKNTGATEKQTATKQEIREAQKALKDKGMYSGAVNGVMSPEWEQALRDFQTKSNLKATGKLDNDTKTALGIKTEQPKGATGKSKTGEPPATTEPGQTKRAPGRSSMESSQDVRQVQMALKEKGFNPGQVDGAMGPKTKKALAQFQRQENLFASGNIDPTTLIALGVRPAPSEPGEAQRLKPSAEPTPTMPAPQQTQPYQTRPQSQNMPQQYMNLTPDQMEQVRTALRDRGFDPGTGDMQSPQMITAIKEFQKQSNITATGMLDEPTMRILAVRAQTYPDTTAASARASAQNTVTPPAAVNPSYPQAKQAPETTTQEYPATTEPTTKHANGKHHAKETKGEAKSHMERVTKATAVLTELTTASDHRIPDSLLQRADGIAVFPGMVKGAFGVGGRYGKGLVSERLPDGRWSDPVFVDIGGGSFGAQIGVSSTDLVLVFTDKGALRNLEQGHELKLGVDAGVVAGPVGRTGEAGTDLNLKSGVLAYSRSKGLFAGVALDGAVINIDHSANRDVYGGEMTAGQIWTSATPNTTVQPFVAALQRLAPKRVTSL